MFQSFRVVMKQHAAKHRRMVNYRRENVLCTVLWAEFFKLDYVGVQALYIF